MSGGAAAITDQARTPEYTTVSERDMRPALALMRWINALFAFAGVGALRVPKGALCEFVNGCSVRSFSTVSIQVS